MLEINFLPFPELNTQRLLLRRVTKMDIEAIYSLRANPEVMKYIPKTCDSLADAEAFFNVLDGALIDNTGISWAITLNEKPEKMIGTLGFWRLVKEHFRAEIGYSLLPEFWRKGIMKEAINAIMEYGFHQMGLHSVEAQIDPENIASERILLSVGFVQEGYFKENFFANGKFDDTAVFSKLKQ
ncbi:MAG: GNAT family N-acetyltransferase [Ginsengibacter sp.]|jgi:ribosomal-protein-alanine N-acetyltransferase